MLGEDFASFEPIPWIRSGHAQTLAGFFFPGALPPYRARQHQVHLEDGDKIVLHDDVPEDWKPGGRTVLLLHGLAGCHLSPYMQRTAAKLAQRGKRVFRMDLRGAGAGAALARKPYHSGRSPDAAQALEYIARLCPGSPTTIVGFSLGGNITLKLLGEAGDNPPGNLDGGMAVCPPIDLLACSANLRKLPNRVYDRYFVQLLVRQVRERRVLVPDAELPELIRTPRILRDFDDQFTAQVWGFGTAEDYYAQASSAPHLERIRLRTLILAAKDDPLIPSSPFETAPLGPSATVVLTEAGGHLGYLARRPGRDRDRRWLDWRVVDWIESFDR